MGQEWVLFLSQCLTVSAVVLMVYAQETRVETFMPGEVELLDGITKLRILVVPEVCRSTKYQI